VLILRRSNQDIVNQAVLEVSDRVLYDVEKMRQPVPHGALDARLVGLPELWYKGDLLADSCISSRESPARPACAKPAARDFIAATGISVTLG
jgi:hypothetical protein